jgi:hypothetical protein
MSEDQNLEPEADVEGHRRAPRVDGPDTDDVEGHRVAKPRIDGPDGEDDVEGHRFKAK